MYSEQLHMAAQWFWWQGRPIWALVSDGPTFDALLQCVGGISVLDGVRPFVTTNRPERVDRALRRGGRLDMEVEFSQMDRAGQLKMATRILGDVAAAEVAIDDHSLTHDDGWPLSPADFQERLCRKALAEHFGPPRTVADGGHHEDRMPS